MPVRVVGVRTPAGLVRSPVGRAFFSASWNAPRRAAIFRWAMGVGMMVTCVRATSPVSLTDISNTSGVGRRTSGRCTRMPTSGSLRRETTGSRNVARGATTPLQAFTALASARVRHRCDQRRLMVSPSRPLTSAWIVAVCVPSAFPMGWMMGPTKCALMVRGGATGRKSCVESRPIRGFAPGFPRSSARCSPAATLVASVRCTHVRCDEMPTWPTFTPFRPSTVT